jgi:hypothetical protein
VPERRRRDRRAQAMTFNEVNAGAVAFSRNGDPNLGDFDDAVILKTFGEVPEDFAETQTASSIARASYRRR